MKRAAELKKLSSDHHRALVFAKNAKRAGDKDRPTHTDIWSEIEEFYLHELEAHFQVEELYIVPCLKKLEQHDLVKQITEEHTALRKHFQPMAFRTQQALINFGELLEKHVRFEERELFKVIEELFTPEDLAMIEKAH